MRSKRRTWMRMAVCRAMGAVVALCAVTTPLLVRAQATVSLRRITLKPANGMLDSEYVRLSSVRELADGRAIVSDPGSGQLVMVDLMRRSATPLSRKGKGPLEWGMAALINPLAGDSSIMSDFINQRWLLFDGGKAVATVPPDDPAVRAAQVFSGADAKGHVLIKHVDHRPPGVTMITRADSLLLVLVDRRTGKQDTVGRVREMPRRYEKRVRADGRISYSGSVMTEAGAQPEDAHLMLDGTISVVRLEPLRVDFRAPDGTWTHGAPLPIAGARVDVRERERILAQRAQSRRDAERVGFPVPPDGPMPTVLPALSETRPMPLPDGRIALKRRTTAAQPNARYIIVNRRSTIDGEIVLGRREEILGFSGKSVYVKVTDEDDIQRLRRHPWP